jgi:hypothetical protein
VARRLGEPSDREVVELVTEVVGLDVPEGDVLRAPAE